MYVSDLMVEVDINLEIIQISLNETFLMNPCQSVSTFHKRNKRNERLSLQAIIEPTSFLMRPPFPAFSDPIDFRVKALLTAAFSPAIDINPESSKILPKFVDIFLNDDNNTNQVDVCDMDYHSSLAHIFDALLGKWEHKVGCNYFHNGKVNEVSTIIKSNVESNWHEVDEALTFFVFKRNGPDRGASCHDMCVIFNSTQQDMITAKPFSTTLSQLSMQMGWLRTINVDTTFFIGWQNVPVVQIEYSSDATGVYRIASPGHTQCFAAFCDERTLTPEKSFAKMLCSGMSDCHFCAKVSSAECGINYTKSLQDDLATCSCTPCHRKYSYIKDSELPHEFNCWQDSRSGTSMGLVHLPDFVSLIFRILAPFKKPSKPGNAMTFNIPASSTYSRCVPFSLERVKGIIDQYNFKSNLVNSTLSTPASRNCSLDNYDRFSNYNFLSFESDLCNAQGGDTHATGILVCGDNAFDKSVSCTIEDAQLSHELTEISDNDDDYDMGKREVDSTSVRDVGSSRLHPSQCGRLLNGHSDDDFQDLNTSKSNSSTLIFNAVDNCSTFSLHKDTGDLTNRESSFSIDIAGSVSSTDSNNMCEHFGISHPSELCSPGRAHGNGNKSEKLQYFGMKLPLRNTAPPIPSSLSKPDSQCKLGHTRDSTHASDTCNVCNEDNESISMQNLVDNFLQAFKSRNCARIETIGTGGSKEGCSSRILLHDESQSLNLEEDEAVVTPFIDASGVQDSPNKRAKQQSQIKPLMDNMMLSKLSTERETCNNGHCIDYESFVTEKEKANMLSGMAILMSEELFVHQPLGAAVLNQKYGIEALGRSLEYPLDCVVDEVTGVSIIPGNTISTLFYICTHYSVLNQRS